MGDSGMTRQASTKTILAFGYNRPRYVSVLLDSIESAVGSPSWNVVVSLDGNDHSEAYERYAETRATVKTWKDHVGNLRHVARSLEFVASLGADPILFLDEDMIMRRDCLEYASKWNGSDDMFYSLTKGPSHISWFIPLGNVIRNASVEQVCAYVNSGTWIDRPRPGLEVQIMNKHYPGCDAVLCRMLIDLQRTSNMSEMSYVAHIGLVGMDSSNVHLERELFSGSESQWLSNAVRLFAAHRCHSFVPEDFVYA